MLDVVAELAKLSVGIADRDWLHNIARKKGII
jgi:hypothetical protein